MCNIKGTDPSSPEFARNFVAGFTGAMLSSVEFSKLRATVGRCALRSGFLGPESVSPIIMAMLLQVEGMIT